MSRAFIEELKMAWIGLGDRDKFIEEVLDSSNIYRIFCLKWFKRAAEKNIHDSFRGLAVAELGNPALLRLPVSEFFKGREDSFRACPNQGMDLLIDGGGSFRVLPDDKTGYPESCRLFLQSVTIGYFYP
jgi:hypothetical protein